MITLHILQLLADNDFGTMNQDLFWEKLPLDKNGVAIMSRGGPVPGARTRNILSFDLYCRGKNDLTSADRLERIRQFLINEYPVCDLPVVPSKSNKLYKNVRFVLISNVENLGLDETDRLLWRLSCEVQYLKET